MPPDSSKRKYDCCILGIDLFGAGGTSSSFSHSLHSVLLSSSLNFASSDAAAARSSSLAAALPATEEDIVGTHS